MVDVCGDSSLSGDLVFATWRGITLDSEDGCCLTGATSSSGDVMECDSRSPGSLDGWKVTLFGALMAHERGNLI